jgi:hypothetical protein
MLLLLACTTPEVQSSTPAPPTPIIPDRIVAVGDLHGDLEAALAVLKLAKVVDESGHWAGGKSILVQTGDTTDRGPDSRGVLKFLRELQGEAKAAGGAVVPLLGNHETMNMLGDWRYVSPEDLNSYGGEEARKVAFSSTGEDGSWLRSLDGVAKVGSTVFAHGGIDARWAKVGIPGINQQIHEALQIPNGKMAAVMGSDGPLWNRALVLSDEATACAELKQALQTLSASRMVVGHTTREDGKIQSRCDQTLWIIDTGISAHYGRHLAALEITPTAITPLYP